MNRNLLPQLGRRNLKNWGISLLISFFLAAGVLIVIVLKAEKFQVKRTQLSSEKDGFKHNLNLITPAELGVDGWQVGDYAEYQYSQYLSQVPSFETMVFRIIGELKNADSLQHWLRITGTVFEGKVPDELYQLVSPHDMWMTSANRRHKPPQKHVSSESEHFAVKLVKLGQDKIETQAGHFECMHYRVELGPDLPAPEIWADPKVRPLGIVRLQSKYEVLELTSFGQGRKNTVPNR